MNFCFGSDELRFSLLDATGPVATAREARSGKILAARDGLLVFPGDDPPPYLYFSEGERWILENREDMRVVTDGDVVATGERHWTLHLPTAVESTINNTERALTLADLRWVFAVSADEEFVSVKVQTPDGERDLGPRSHHYMMLILARLRADETADNDGWTYADELAQMLGFDESHLNVQIFRARKELGALGVVDAVDVIERRRNTRQLRSAIRRFTEKTV